jgi:hypothetical protein
MWVAIFIGGEELSDKVYVGSHASSLEVGEPFEPISRVTMRVDEDHYYTAGDDTGRTLECENIWATQEMVNNVYNQLKGFVYKPFKATDAMIDPAAEPGDGVTVRGEYFMLTSMDTVFDAKCASTIGAPGEKEIDHEYPYMSWQEREMERRVKLGQKYQGVSITRKDGLVIAETDGETDGAKVVLNSKKLAFYDAGGQEQLYFDPAAGCYKFRGALNVNDNFIVDKLGNVVMKGGITLDGPIRWGTDNVPNKKRYAASTSGPWHDTMQSGDIYCCDWDYVSEKWGGPYKFIGTDGSNGRPGSDADVTRDNIVLAMLERIDEDGLYVETINGKQCLGINASAIQAGILSGRDILGCTYYSKGRVGQLNLSSPNGGLSDLIFKNAQDGRELFKVEDQIGAATLYLNGVPIIEVSTMTGVNAYLSDEVTVHARFL